MVEINDFNLETRCQDYKFDFHKKCTKEFTQSCIKGINEFHKCIAGQM